MGLHLPEYDCPFCRRCVTLIPVPGAHSDLNECSKCHRTLSLQPDGALAVPAPRRLAIRSEPGAFEVAVVHGYVTFGLADSAIRYRVETDAVAWTKPTWFDTLRERLLPLAPRLRVGPTTYERLPRRRVRRFDWRLFESGTRGTKMYESWFDVVFVAHDGSERVSGHRLYFDEATGLTLTLLLDWALDGGVPHAPGAGYRATPDSGPRPLRLVDRRGVVTTLA